MACTQRQLDISRKHQDKVRGGRPITFTPRERFLLKTRIIGYLSCWMWEGAGHPTGYGRFGISPYKVTFAHRASWELFRGPIPAGMYVCHTCDVRLCVNPLHLFIGTAKDNMQDASKKGRIVVPKESYLSDENHQVAKLTNEQVREIRNSEENGKVLATRFGVGKECIWMARTRRTFKDVS